MLDNGAAGGGPTVGGDLTWADLDLSNWRRYGKDRLYISARGRDLGYLDNQTGELHVADADMGPVLHDLLRHHLVEAKAVTAAAPAKPRRAAPPNAGWQEGVAKATRERGNTLSESALWHELENGSPFTWERELVWGSYRLDFYCADARLAVEVDGSSHSTRRERDAQRDAWLAGQGVETRRVDARDVERDAAGVVSSINRECIRRAGRLERERPVAVPPPPVSGWRRLADRLRGHPAPDGARPEATPYVGERLGRSFLCGGCRTEQPASSRSRRNPARCRTCAADQVETA